MRTILRMTLLAITWEGLSHGKIMSRGFKPRFKQEKTLAIAHNSRIWLDSVPRTSGLGPLMILPPPNKALIPSP